MINQIPTIRSLASAIGMNHRPVIKHCRELEKRGWMRIIPEGKALRPAAVVPAEVEKKVALETRDEIRLSPFRGEATMRSFVVWIVAPSVKLVFNARPSFLQNRETKQNLEYDIFAPERLWAREYQGDQHFGPTTQYPGDKEFVERFKRDQLKALLSEQNNIRLSIVTKRDLTLEKMLEDIPSDIPRRTFDTNGPFVRMLEKLGKEIAAGRDWDRE